LVKLLKHILIEEAFELVEVAWDEEKAAKVKIKLLNYNKINGEDLQVRDVIIMLDIYTLKNKRRGGAGM